jgi:hypothetical protein
MDSPVTDAIRAEAERLALLARASRPYGHECGPGFELGGDEVVQFIAQALSRASAEANAAAEARGAERMRSAVAEALRNAFDPVPSSGSALSMTELVRATLQTAADFVETIPLPPPPLPGEERSFASDR